MCTALMARFPFQFQLRDFAASPPMTALLKPSPSQSLPLVAHYVSEFDVAPPQKSQERTQAGLRGDALA